MGIFHWKKNKKTEEVNPYAAPITPYQQARAQLAQGPVSRDIGALDTRTDSFASSTAPPPYKQSPALSGSNDRFGDEKYGSQKGYGSNPYDTNASAFNANQRGPGGYGGLEEDTGKNDLFGNAGGRYVPQQQSNANSPALNQPSPNQYGNDPNKSSLLGGAQDRYSPSAQPGAADDEFDGYGAPRELTEEELEEQQVQAINKEAKDVRKEGLASLDRSLAIADSAINTALGTYARLGEQGDRLHRTEHNLDDAAAKSRIAEDKTKELKTAGNMFHFSNPIMRSKREQRDMDNTLERHRMEREIREATRKDAYMSNQEMEQGFKDLPVNKPQLLGRVSQSNRKKSDFELLDSEDEEDEEGIDDRLDMLADRVGTLGKAARGMGSRVEEQNILLDRLEVKSDAVDDHVRMNRSRLDRIR